MKALRSRPAEDLETFPIRTVASLTGVNPITLRAWERRYDLIRPLRTQSGHRGYTRDDIDRIHRILALIAKGMTIGQVRPALPVPAGKARKTAAETQPWRGYRERLIAAIPQFDEDRLEDVYNELLSLYSTELVTAKVLSPLLEQLGERWQSAEGSVAEEHFFAVYLRNKLGARFHHRSRDKSGPRLLAACLPGEHHEAGLLLFALAAHDQGYRLVLLGADMPLAELPEVVHRGRCSAVVLSGTMIPPHGVLEDELSSLVRAIPVPVFVGGLVSVLTNDTIAAAGAEPLGTDVGAALQRMRARLAAAVEPTRQGRRRR